MMNYDNKIKIWDIIEDDLVLIIKNTSESSQSVVLFDYANFDVNGVVTTYQITIPTASFPITNAFVSFVGGSILTYIGASTKDTLASNLNSVGVPFMTRTTVGSNEIYTYNNTQSSLVALALGGNAFATITFSATTTQGGASGITITLVNMNYSQFVSSLNMLGDVLGIKKHGEEMVNEKAGDVYSARQAEIIKDLGNDYFLGDDSYDDDDGFTKTGYSVYKQVGDDSYRMVGSVDMSPYSNPPGHVQNEIKKLISSDQNVAENTDYLEEK